MAADDLQAAQCATLPQHLPLAVRVAFACVGRLPLRLVHALGAALGRLALLLFADERRRLQENLRCAGLQARVPSTDCAAESGKMLLELLWLWRRPQAEVARLVRSVSGVDRVMEAHARGCGVVFLTPHLGCFEVAAQYAASYAPITVMYRPPRQRAFRALAESGRRRENVRLVPSNTRGATALLAALRRGEWIGLLPDQVPAADHGEWAEFFGRPAYTMTLAPRLAERSGAAIVLACCERLPHGCGYAMHLEPLPAPLPGETDVRCLNRALENLIRRCPAQYLWSYNRYKVPAGVVGPQGLCAGAAVTAADGRNAGGTERHPETHVDERKALTGGG